MKKIKKENWKVCVVMELMVFGVSLNDARHHTEVSDGFVLLL